MRFVNAFVTFAILTPLTILAWSSYNPEDPFQAELISASLWLLGISLAFRWR